MTPPLVVSQPQPQPQNLESVPVTQAKKTAPKCQVDGYVGVKAGVNCPNWLRPDDNGLQNQLVAGVNGGMNLKAGIFSLGVDATAGTALQGKVEVGVKPNLTPNWNLSILANAEGTASMLASGFEYESKASCTAGSDKVDRIFISKGKSEYYPTDLFLGGRVGAEYHNKKVNVGFGLEAGARPLETWGDFTTNYNINNRSQVEVTTNITETFSYPNGRKESTPINIKQSPNTNVNLTVPHYILLNRPGVVISPYVNASVDLGKGFEFKADASLRQGTVGVSWNF